MERNRTSNDTEARIFESVAYSQVGRDFLWFGDSADRKPGQRHDIPGIIKRMQEIMQFPEEIKDKWMRTSLLATWTYLALNQDLKISENLVDTRCSWTHVVFFTLGYVVRHGHDNANLNIIG